MSSVLNFTSFLSGCLPIAFIHFIVNYYSTEWTVLWFTRLFLAITLISCMLFVVNILHLDKCNNQDAAMSNIRRKDIFVSGAISYYVLPFISFVANGEVGVVILLVLIPLFLKIFHNNRMFLYTPILDIFGYKILECDLTIFNKTIHANVITLNSKNLVFTGENHVKIHKIDEGIYFVRGL